MSTEPITPERLRAIYYEHKAATEGHWPTESEALHATSVALAAIPELIAEVRRLTPIYTNDAPTMPGWYWCKQNGAEEITEVLLADDPNTGPHLRARPRKSHGGLSVARRVESFPGRWSGPIPMPGEREEV